MERKKRPTKTQWKEAKKLWETGCYTVPQLSEKLSVSQTSVKNHILKEKWKKGKLEKKVEDQIEKNVVELMSELGWPLKKRIQNFVKAFEAKKQLMSYGNIIGQEEDWVARLKAHDMAFKLAGEYSPEKQNVTAVNQNIEIVREDLKKLSEEDLIELRRISAKLTDGRSN